MYVDKKLRGVHAVQTLGRLNRIHPAKEDPFVLDFVNTPDSILEAFAPYYREAVLSSRTDPNLLYDLKVALDDGRHVRTHTKDAIGVTSFRLQVDVGNALRSTSAYVLVRAGGAA